MSEDLTFRVYDALNPPCSGGLLYWDVANKNQASDLVWILNEFYAEPGKCKFVYAPNCEHDETTWEEHLTEDHLPTGGADEICDCCGMVLQTINAEDNVKEEDDE